MNRNKHMKKEPSQKESAYLNRIHATFINQKVEAVYYEELHYETDRDFWEHADDVHSVDMNIIFKLTNGQLIQIKWDNEFYCYGVGFEAIAGINRKEGFKLIDVTNNKNWSTRIGKTISSIDVYWHESEGQEYQKTFGILMPKGKKKQIRLPLTWAIKFEDDCVYVAAFEIGEECNNYYWADNLTIFFSEENVKKYNLQNDASSLT